MNHWLFIVISYVLTLLGTLGLALLSYRAMRRAEARADQMGKKQ